MTTTHPSLPSLINRYVFKSDTVSASIGVIVLAHFFQRRCTGRLILIFDRRRRRRQLPGKIVAFDGVVV